MSSRWIESLDSRLLFGGHQIEMTPALNVGAQPPDPRFPGHGIAPAQIRTAYGIDQLGPLNGQGQTIAIVDAYSNPVIENDLNVFDAQFGLPAAPSFHVVNQNGRRRLPAPDLRWAEEISLDVEWAHAIAPAAALVLVEANSDALPDLMQATRFAMHLKQTSVVSISWTGSEFEGESRYDGVFLTPPGHKGITVIAAAGGRRRAVAAASGRDHGECDEQDRGTKDSH